MPEWASIALDTLVTSTVTYYGCNGVAYAERYPAVEIL
jgi:hypothetical protein